ncbi:MAG: cytochrome c biogenesis protein CcdA [Magnetococcales bacterium]|nr:cytochrome c biogenesis protein CcdA [Magnetococcales bacterium]
MQEVTWVAAFFAGVMSFVSPCVLPLVPAYISFMTGVELDRLRSGDATGRIALALNAGLHSGVFVLGFSLVFILLGASAFALGQILMHYMQVLSRVGGILIILFGLHFMGIFRLGFLNLEARFNPEQKPPGLWGTFVIGLAFAFGWTPCVGPILATILGLAGAQETLGKGILLLVAYSAGLGLPFIVGGLAINGFLAFFARMRRHLGRVEKISGGLLVLAGVLIFLGDINRLSAFLMRHFPGLAGIG